MKNSVTKEDIVQLLSEAEAAVTTVHGKCTIVSVKLKNGFVITESSACVDPANYNEELGFNECMKRIEDKLWELEGYVLQKKLYDELVYAAQHDKKTILQFGGAQHDNHH